ADHARSPCPQGMGEMISLVTERLNRLEHTPAGLVPDIGRAGENPRNRAFGDASHFGYVDDRRLSGARPFHDRGETTVVRHPPCSCCGNVTICVRSPSTPGFTLCGLARARG